MTSVIHRQIIRVLEEKQNNIVIGNPNAIRDFTHVIDTIRAYILVCEKGRKAEHIMFVLVKELVSSIILRFVKLFMIWMFQY